MKMVDLNPLINKAVALALSMGKSF